MPMCPICKKDFETPYIYKIYCSAQCKRKSANRKLYPKDYIEKFKRAVGGFDCRMCGKRVYPVSGDKRSVFCSKECEKRWWKHPHDYKTGTRIVNIPKKYRGW